MCLSTVIKFHLLVIIFELFLINTTWACGGRTVLKVGITPQEKETILNLHNRVRQVVALGQVGGQPPAANMIKLKWNDKLAQQAQRWAESCSSYIHDPGRHIGNNYPVGQNIATKWTTQAPRSYQDAAPQWWADAVVKWFEEYKDYIYQQHGGRSGRRQTGHYTQLIWADTMTVGCGFVLYLDSSRKYTKKYVCNYGPSGNVIGKIPYHRGRPQCNKYRMAPSTNYNGLCLPQSHNNNYRPQSHNNNYRPHNSYNYPNQYNMENKDQLPNAQNNECPTPYNTYNKDYFNSNKNKNRNNPYHNDGYAFRDLYGYQG